MAPLMYTRDGVPRLLNLRPSPSPRLAEIPRVRDVLPASEIVARDFWPSALSIMDQGNIGACNAFASAQCLHFARYMSGQAHLPLSPWWIYGRLVNGRDTGSSIVDALDLIRDQGCPPDSMVKARDFSGRYPAEVNAAAKRNRLEIGGRLKTWEEILSAVARGQAVNLSVFVGPRFGNLDGDGVPPPQRGPGNHAVMCGGGIKLSRRWGPLIRTANSWRIGWGLDGFCWLGKANIEAGSWSEAFTVQAVTEDPDDGDEPPAVA